MNVRDLIEALEELDPETLVLNGTWQSSWGEYTNLRAPDHFSPTLRVVTKRGENRWQDRDPGAGTDNERYFEVLILG